MNRGQLLLASTLALLTGCQTSPVLVPEETTAVTAVEPPTVPPAVEPEVKLPVRPAASDGEALLAYFDQVRKLPAAEFTKEIDTVRKLYARLRTDAVRMRYAILLSAPAAGPGDDLRAVELLEPMLKSTDSSLRALALLISAQIQEQRRAQALQQKLDALMSLDKTLIERGRPGL
jgi:hypothetical protein